MTLLIPNHRRACSVLIQIFLAWLCAYPAVVLAAACQNTDHAAGLLSDDSATLPASAHTTSNDINVCVGVLAFMGPRHAQQEWDSVRRFLQSALPGHSVQFAYLDLETLTREARARSFDFVLTNPGHYVSLELELGASRIATIEQERHTVSGLGLGSTVFTRAGSELSRLEELKGRTLVATTRDGFGGYQIVWRELAALGIDPEKDLAGVSAVGFPMTRVLNAVANGDADAGIVRACVLESIPDWTLHYKVLSPQPETGFQCAVSTRLYPDWPIATLPQTPRKLAHEVALALLQMPVTRDGRRFTVAADYQSVHDLFRELQIGPYAYLREQGVAALARRHWPVLALLGAVILLWLLYTYRVEKLVHSRTRALRETLEERMQIEARMRASQESVDHLSRLSILGELSTTLAHELSQPLASIANYGRSLLRRLDTGQLDDDATRFAATEIAQQAQHAANVLSRIRNFSRKRISVREERRPTDVVMEAVSLFVGMLSEAPQINIDNQLSAEVGIRVDGPQIQQVILNLLKNSMDAMSGLPVDQRRIDITLTQQGPDMFIHVRDYGPGLPDNKLVRLFEPFYTDKPDGLGLGLSISYSIVEAHGGTLSAQAAEPGRGMIFSLSLPVVRTPDSPPTKDH